MSYDIRLINPITTETIEADEPHLFAGGTYAVGGTTELWLSVTYNYADLFSRVFGRVGIRNIHGMTGAQSIPVLRHAAGQLDGTASNNYWDATPGNAKAALLQLLELAALGPNGVWDVN